MMGRLGQSRIQVLRCSRYRCARARIFLGRFFFFLCLQTLESREILLTKSSHLSCYWNVCKPKSWEKISCTAPLEKTLAKREQQTEKNKRTLCVFKKVKSLVEAAVKSPSFSLSLTSTDHLSLDLKRSLVRLTISMIPPLHFSHESTQQMLSFC